MALLFYEFISVLSFYELDANNFKTVGFDLQQLSLMSTLFPFGV